MLVDGGKELRLASAYAPKPFKARRQFKLR